jgi:transcriptional regulator with XRE-family HTH domain
MRLVSSRERRARYGLRFTLANFVRCRRQQLQMSIEEAADLAGIAAAEWHAIENGYLPEPGSVSLHCIAGALQARTKSLLQLCAISRAQAA